MRESLKYSSEMRRFPAFYFNMSQTRCLKAFETNRKVEKCKYGMNEVIINKVMT